MATPPRRSTTRTSHPRSATVEDVAVRAGVSVATVSRALRGLSNVAPTTRLRVERAALDLRYRPDPNASRLAAGRSRAIGVAMPVLGPWYFSQVLAGVEAVLAPSGYELLVYASASLDDHREFLAEALPIHKRIDGLVLIDLPLPPADVAEWSGTGVHIVTVGQRTEVFPSVTIDDSAAAKEVVAHLVALGHRDFAVIGGNRTPRTAHSDVPEARVAGFRSGLRAHGLRRAVPEMDGGFTAEGGRIAMEQLLQGRRAITAVFAMSDEMAFGALQSIASAGLRVPGDISVVGFDDHDLAASVRLTTVRQGVADMGSRAARLLLDHLAGGSASRHEVAPTQLVVRGTTGPAPRSGGG